MKTVLTIIDLVIWTVCLVILHTVLCKFMGDTSMWVSGTIMGCTTTYAKWEQFRRRLLE